MGMRTQLAGMAFYCSVILCGSWMVSCSPKTVETYSQVDQEPNISPDYSGTFVPPNIAPLNFQVLEDGHAYFVSVRSDRGRPVHIFSKTRQIRIPISKWRALLETNRDHKIFFDVYVRGADRHWRRFRPIANTVAREDIDETLVFRFMKPGYGWWKDIGIYQRNLTNYDVSAVLHSRSFDGGCLNCHSFAGNDPDTMTIALRSATYGSDTVLARNGVVDRIGARWGYTAWHPSGQLAVYSINKVTQFFHAGSMEVRDVVDLDSALVCYRVERRKASSPKELADKGRLETYPAWSPDGKYLYYCSSPVLWEDRNAVPPQGYDRVKYNLRRIRYDIAADRWGEAETVLSAEDTGQSILLPRISPDGRFLLFCMCRYGCFPAYQPSSDLYLMNLATRQHHKLPINSEFSESWHSWSSNSRWIAFSSKRRGGLFTRTYFSYVDDTGTAHKPFVLPQRSANCYDSLLETYSVPELLKGPITVSKSLLARAARARPSITPEIPITAATPKVGPSSPWEERE
ncbi:MAG: PD40 domain-containing protein [Phycisphaerales bacterium]|nr:MAG: PD40 domain-containing protein [Phycisphaerales bacterium]